VHHLAADRELAEQDRRDGLATGTLVGIDRAGLDARKVNDEVAYHGSVLGYPEGHCFVGADGFIDELGDAPTEIATVNRKLAQVAEPRAGRNADEIGERHELRDPTAHLGPGRADPGVHRHLRVTDRRRELSELSVGQDRLAALHLQHHDRAGLFGGRYLRLDELGQVRVEQSGDLDDEHLGNGAGGARRRPGGLGRRARHAEENPERNEYEPNDG